MIDCIFLRISTLILISIQQSSLSFDYETGYSRNVVEPRYKKGLWWFYPDLVPSQETFKPVAPISIKRNGKKVDLGAATAGQVLNSPEMIKSEQPGFNGIARYV